MKDRVREHIYLAALLHDIGKFYQRADTGSVGTSKFLKEHCKTEATFCPSYKGFYTHKHVLWTAQFIEDNSEVFRNLVGSDFADLTDRNNLVNLSAGHHLAEGQISDLGRLIKKADCLSSGMDRGSDIAMKDAQDEEESGWDSFKKKRMTSILETISLSDAELESKTNWQHIPIEKLTLTQDCFPKKRFEAEADYLSLWNAFIGEFKFIQANTYKAFAETLLNLLQKYTSCVPASTINFPDVSLYDHLKTTAALSVCLYDYEKGEKAGDEPFLLVGADFSGIQPYIYQIVSKYAGKNLKGRSFYLRLLSDTVVRYLLKQLNLFQANIIYNSGGGFYLLAPNTKYVKEQLKEAVLTIEKKLFESHGTSLFVAIDSVGLSEDALMHKNGGLGEVWGKLFQLRDRKKNTKFSQLIKDNYSQFFKPLMQGGDAQRDTITGEEFLATEKPIKKDSLILKPTTAKQIEIGEKLRDVDLLVVKDGEPLSYWSNMTKIEPLGLGFTYYFLNDNDLKSKKEELKASADKVTVITLNGKNGNCDFMRTVDGINNIYALDFYGGNEFNNSTFEEMCDAKNEEGRFSRMGVLRMDVDNLGHIFQQGIPSERATLSRYAALSRSFDFFFSGYLNTIWKEVAPEKSFIVYSGGDDVFIVGSWDVTIEIAKRIKEDFREFTCENKAFSVSGGVAIISPSYPIMKGAEESDTEEKAAKGHSVKGVDKNALSFMDFPLNWDLEFTTVEKLKDKIVDLLGSNKLPKSFISKVMSHYANSEMKKHQITRPKTYWMLTYDLSRMKSRSAGEDVNSMIKNCIEEVCDKNKGKLNGEPIHSDYHPLELWAFASRWAELEYRSK